MVETLPSLPPQVRVYVCVFVWGSKAPFGLEKSPINEALIKETRLPSPIPDKLS